MTDDEPERYHRLRIWPEFFDAIESHALTCQVRRADRDFRVGDLLLLEEYIPRLGRYTGRTMVRSITYLQDALAPAAPSIPGVDQTRAAMVPAFVLSLRYAGRKLKNGNIIGGEEVKP